MFSLNRQLKYYRKLCKELWNNYWKQLECLEKSFKIFPEFSQKFPRDLLWEYHQEFLQEFYNIFTDFFREKFFFLGSSTGKSCKNSSGSFPTKSFQSSSGNSHGRLSGIFFGSIFLYSSEMSLRISTGSSSRKSSKDP